MINWQRVTELRSEIGPDGFSEVVDIFLEEVETALRRLRAHGTAPQLEADLHFLKGCAWNLGFREFGAHCNDGELQVRRGLQAPIDFDAIENCYDLSKVVFASGLENIALGRDPEAD